MASLKPVRFLFGMFSFVKVLRKMFYTTITTYNAYVNPYAYENVDLNGTDG
jgi:hypothetical protein